MPLVPLNSEENPNLVTFTILSDGEVLPPEVGVASISIQKVVNRIPSARLVIFDGDVASSDFEMSGSDWSTPGKELEIKAGYNSEEATIFKGIIVRHGLEVNNNSSKLILELKDPAFKMTIGRKNKYFFESTDSDILEEIVGSYGDLSAEIEATSSSHPEMVQYYVSDWDFILTRAEVIGKLALVEDGAIKIMKPEVSADPVLDLQFGANVINFEAEMDARTQYKNTSSFAWDQANQEVLEAEASDPGIDFQGDLSGSDLADSSGEVNYRLQHSGMLDDQELQDWADAQLMRSRLSKIQGRVKIIGDNIVKVGDMINLEGFGSRFNGKAFVSSVYHEISPNQKWLTHLGLGLDSRFISKVFDDILDVSAAGIIPAIKGIHIGKVTDLEDPLGENRVRVHIPVIDPDSEGSWARIATPDAGGEGDARGLFFLPEIGDEVIVGFINEDPRDPLVLGSLFSSAKPAPFEQTADNFQKGIVTKSQLKMTFDDDLISVQIETPNGNLLNISDDEVGISLVDENGNKVVLNADGILLESAKDLILKASGDIKAEGTNIEMTASSSIKAEGSSGAELTSSGSTTVQGSIVQIN